MALVDVVAVAFYCAVSVVVLVTVSDEVHCINGYWSAALGAIKGDKPSLKAAATRTNVKVALINNTESSSIFLLVENTVLQNS